MFSKTRVKQALVILALTGSLSYTNSAIGSLEETINNNQEIVAQQSFQLSEDYILDKGIILKSDLWDRLKKGELSGAGRDNKSWADYITTVESYRTNLFSRLKQPVAEELDKYPYMIYGLGGGGSWSYYHHGGVEEWDDISDLHLIKFEGVHLAYSKDWLPEETTVVHEYFHGIWSVYGTYASKQTRKIDKDQFETDTIRYINDTKYLNTAEMEEIKEGWTVEEAEGRFTTTQALSERFASLAEICYTNPNSLPDYIRRHFEPFFNN